MNERTAEVTARRIDMQDYDEACAIVTWCNGSALGEWDEPYVVQVPGPEGPEYAKDGDWIEPVEGAGFRVVSPETMEARNV